MLNKSTMCTGCFKHVNSLLKQDEVKFKNVQACNHPKLFFYNSLDLEFETILSLEFEMVLTVFSV